jgi:hypothetical protein
MAERGSRKISSTSASQVRVAASAADLTSGGMALLMVDGIRGRQSGGHAFSFVAKSLESLRRVARPRIGLGELFSGASQPPIDLAWSHYASPQSAPTHFTQSVLSH